MNKHTDEYYRLLKSALSNGDISTNLSDLYNQMKDDARFSRALFDERRYPVLPEVNKNVLSDMRKYIDSKGCLKSNACEAIKNSPVALLLYFIAWKNGDLCKFGPLMEGIESNEEQIPTVKNNSYVFYQFGRHIADRTQPIVDQHTVRCMLYYQYLNNEVSLNKRYTKDPSKIFKFEKPSKSDLETYTTWVSSVFGNKLKESGKQESVQSIFDKIAFTLGKSIKAKHSQR